MTQRHNRREFLSLTGAGVAGAVGGQWLGAAPGAAALAAQAAAPAVAAAVDAQHADLVVFNAKVYTVDARAPRAEAFAVKAGRFVAVGSTADVKALVGKGTQTFDAKQMTVVPGFIDCHNHAPGNVLLYDVLVGNPFEVEFVTIASIVDKLRAKAQKTPPGGWVEGFFFDDTKVKDNRQLNVHDLDQVSKDHPVAVHHRGGHTSFYNSKALEMAGISKGTPDSSGGTFDKDANGELNGRVTDRARAAFNKVGTRPTFTADQTMQRDRDGLAYISKQFVRYGVTSVHHEGGNLLALQQVRAHGDLLHRVSYESSGKATGSDDRCRHRDRFRRRVDPVGRHLRAHGRRVVLRAHDGDQPALRRYFTAVQRQRHGDAGRSQRVDRAGASGGHPGQLSRQWGCRHRHGAHGGGAGAEAVSASRRASQDHALQLDQRRSGAAYQGDRHRPGDVHHVCVLQLRQVPFLRRRPHDAMHGLSHVPRRRDSGGGRLGLQSGTVRPAHGHSGNGDAHRVEWRDLGSQPADHRGGGAAGQHDQRRLRLA